VADERQSIKAYCRLAAKFCNILAYNYVRVEFGAGLKLLVLLGGLNYTAATESGSLTLAD